MQEKLNLFERNSVWELVPKQKDIIVTGTKWVFQNKLDGNGVIVRNKARFFAKGYNRQEGIDFDETNTPVARLEAIRMLLAFSCIVEFKSDFPNVYIQKEVYVVQPPNFNNFEFPNNVYD